MATLMREIKEGLNNSKDILYSWNPYSNNDNTSKLYNSSRVAITKYLNGYSSCLNNRN
jgi:hypothetical protein